MLSPNCFPSSSKDKDKKDDIIKYLSDLITKADNQEHLTDPTNFFLQMIKIYKEIMYLHAYKFEEHISLYQVLKYISQHSYKKASSSSNLILKDLFDVIYNNRQVDFSRYDYVHDVDQNTNLIDFDVNITMVTNYIKTDTDLVRLLKKLGVKETLFILKLLVTKVYVEYSNLNANVEREK